MKKIRDWSVIEKIFLFFYKMTLLREIKALVKEEYIMQVAM